MYALTDDCVAALVGYGYIDATSDNALSAASTDKLPSVLHNPACKVAQLLPKYKLQGAHIRICRRNVAG